MFHVHVRQDNTAGVVIVDAEYPGRVCFSLIAKVRFLWRRGFMRCPLSHLSLIFRLVLSASMSSRRSIRSPHGPETQGTNVCVCVEEGRGGGGGGHSWKTKENTENLDKAVALTKRIPIILSPNVFQYYSHSPMNRQWYSFFGSARVSCALSGCDGILSAFYSLSIVLSLPLAHHFYFLSLSFVSPPTLAFLLSLPPPILFFSFHALK